MRLFLIFIIVFSCFSAGFLKAVQFYSRKQMLSELIDSLQLMKSGMSYRRLPLPQVFEELKEKTKGQVQSFFSCLSEEIKNKQNQNVAKIWEKTAISIFQEKGLLEEDIGIWVDLGLEIGRTDLKGQLDMLEYTEIKLLKALEEATCELKTKGKMYGMLGGCCGILIAVVLL